MLKLLFLAAAIGVAIAQAAPGGERRSTAATSFENFDRRAKAGERLNVVFFGASLTWGANASDPVYTSYRPQTIDWLEQMYPKAVFKSWDAAIGGTGSNLGVFRFDRDVLGHEADIIFLDFSANDDIYSAGADQGASYESLVRRGILDARCPVVVMIFPFKWNVAAGSTAGMAGRDQHIEIASAYNCPVGDAITLGIEHVKAKQITLDEIWPADGVHPGDRGYALFADAAKAAYTEAVDKKMVCSAPEKMLYESTYMTNARVRISSLEPLPEGWSVGRPNLVAAWYDGLMSRWLDDETIAANQKTVTENGKKKTLPVKVKPLRVKVNASIVMLFGEETKKSGSYRVCIDDKYLAVQRVGQDRKIVSEFSANSERMGGNRQHAQVIVNGLDTSVDHIIEIEPLLSEDSEQELRLESICVAGGKATVERVE